MRNPGPHHRGSASSEFYSLREMCVLADWKRAAGRQVARPEDHEREWAAQLDVAAILAQAALTNTGVGAAVGGIAGGTREARLGGTRTDTSPPPLPGTPGAPSPIPGPPPAPAPAASPRDALDAMENSGGAPLVEQVAPQPAPRAERRAPDPELTRWMVDTLQFGEWPAPVVPAAPVPPANLNMIRLTEEEAQMAVQALWVQSDAPRGLPSMLDATAVQQATRAAIDGEQTLRRRIGDANTNALIADVTAYARQGRPSYDQLLDYVQDRYAIGGATPLRFDIRRNAGAGDDWLAEHWDEIARRATAGEVSAYYRGDAAAARASRPAPRAAITAKAEDLETQIRAFERGLAGQPIKEQAAAIRRKFGFFVDPEDLRTGNVFWRVGEGGQMQFAAGGVGAREAQRRSTRLLGRSHCGAASRLRGDVDVAEHRPPRISLHSSRSIPAAASPSAGCAPSAAQPGALPRAHFHGLDAAAPGGVCPAVERRPVDRRYRGAFQGQRLPGVGADSASHRARAAGSLPRPQEPCWRRHSRPSLGRGTRHAVPGDVEPDRDDGGGAAGLRREGHRLQAEHLRAGEADPKAPRRVSGPRSFAPRLDHAASGRGRAARGTPASRPRPSRLISPSPAFAWTPRPSGTWRRRIGSASRNAARRSARTRARCLSCRASWRWTMPPPPRRSPRRWDGPSCASRCRWRASATA